MIRANLNSYFSVIITKFTLIMAEIPDLDISANTKHIQLISEVTSNAKRSGTKSVISSCDFEDTQLAGGDGRNSPPPNCAICLEQCSNKCFADLCMHQFCFTCLLEWVKVKPECPLCKDTLTVIRHNVKSPDQFDEYLVQQFVPDSSEIFSSSSDYSDFESTNDTSDETGSVMELYSCTVSNESANNVLSLSSSDVCEFLSHTTSQASEVLGTQSLSTSNSESYTDECQYHYCDASTPKKMRIDGDVANADAITKSPFKFTENSITTNREAFNQGTSTSSRLQVPYCSERVLTSSSNYTIEDQDN